MSRATGKITECTPAEARERRDQTRAFIDVAEMVLTQSASRHEAHVAAALAVLAAIAAAAAICIAIAEVRTMPRQQSCSRKYRWTTQRSRPSCAGSYPRKTPCTTPHNWSQTKMRGIWYDRREPSLLRLNGSDR